MQDPAVTVDTSFSDWSLVAFDSSFNTLKVGSKNFGMQLMGSNVQTDGSCSVENFTVINGNSNLALNYDGNVAPQATSIDTSVIANVIFTIGWSTGNGGDSSDPELPMPSNLNYRWSDAGVLAWDEYDFDEEVDKIVIRSNQDGVYSTVTSLSTSATSADIKETISTIVLNNFSNRTIAIELWTRDGSDNFLERLDSLDMKLVVNSDEIDYDIIGYNSSYQNVSISIDTINSIYAWGPFNLLIGYWVSNSRGIYVGSLSDGDNVNLKMSAISSSTVSDDVWNLNITTPVDKNDTFSA